MKRIKDQTTEEFLDDLASKAPAPGGGSVAALLGAQAAALVSMVCRLTIGKEKHKNVEKEMEETLERSEKLRERFMFLAEEDKQAYLNVVKEKHSPASLEKAAAVPAETQKLADEVLKLAEIVAEKGNENLEIDTHIAIEAAKLSWLAAKWNVEINLN